METRTDRYKFNEYKKSRVEKNKDLYKMIYTAYDEFENYKVPLEEKEIDLSNVKKDVTSRSDYRKAKQYGEFTNNKIVGKIDVEEDNDDMKKEVYDIKELLNKVKDDSEDDRRTEIKSEKYLDKLHLKEKEKTNLEIIKEKYEDIILDSEEEEKLSNTANLSLEILSDLKSNEDTLVSSPMKEDEDDITETKKDDNVLDKDDSFYSDMYKFKKKDFEDEDEEEDDEDIDDGSNKFLFKILIVIAFIILIALILIYLIGYFT